MITCDICGATIDPARSTPIDRDAHEAMRELGRRVYLEQDKYPYQDTCADCCLLIRKLAQDFTDRKRLEDQKIMDDFWAAVKKLSKQKPTPPTP